MYQLLISILLALGIITSSEQFYQMTSEQQQALEQDHIIIIDDQM